MSECFVSVVSAKIALHKCSSFPFLYGMDVMSGSVISWWVSCNIKSWIWVWNQSILLGDMVLVYWCRVDLQLNNFEIKPGKYLKVNASVANVRLFVGNVPKNRTRDEIFEEFQKSTGNIRYWSLLQSIKNCVVCICVILQAGLFSLVSDI